MLGFLKRLGMLIGGMVVVPVGIVVLLWPIWGWEVARASSAPEIVLVSWAIGVGLAVFVGLLAINDNDTHGGLPYHEPLVTGSQAALAWMISPFLIVILACCGLFEATRWLVTGRV